MKDKQKDVVTSKENGKTGAKKLRQNLRNYFKGSLNMTLRDK